MSNPPFATLSMFEENMARRRAQRKGYLFEKSGHWLLRYRVDTPEIDPETGKPKRALIAVTIAPSRGPDAIGKREAQRLAWEEFLSKLDQSSMRPGSMRTIREFYEQRFKLDVMATLKPTGRVFYQSIVEKHVLPALGSVRLREIGVGQVQDLLNAKLKSGLSVQTAVHVRNCLSAILRHAKAMQWFYGELPTAAARLPEMKREARRALNWEQVCAISKALTEPAATLVVFLTVTGLRIGEAVGLRWKWLNLSAAGRIVNGEVVPPSSLAVRENFVLGRYQSLKTTSSARNVALPEWILPRMLALRTAESGPESPVFAALNGRPLDQHNTAARVLKPIAKELKLPWVSWHVFRHTNATLADMAGFSVTERQRILGHASESMTMHYTKTDLDRLRDRLEGMVDEKKLLN